MLRIGKETLHKSIDNDMLLTRGDTAHINVNISMPDGTAYEMEEGDKLKFSVKQNENDKNTLFQIETTSNEITIESSHTKGLGFGVYYYDVELNTAAGETYTIIECSRFYVGKEVG